MFIKLKLDWTNDYIQPKTNSRINTKINRINTHVNCQYNKQ